jgi:sugar phosphate isomerase/epimerase
MQMLSRRRFLGLTGGFGVAAALDLALPRWALAGPMGLPVGIQLYMVSKPLGADPAGTLKQLYAMGYREVETPGMGKLSAKEWRGLFDDIGLKCTSAHLQFAAMPMMKDAPTIEAQLADAKVMGATYAVSSVLRTFSPEFLKTAQAAMAANPNGPRPTMPKLEALGVDGFKRTAEQMNEAGKKAKAAGLQYAYHNHNFEFEKMPDGSPGYDILLKETDPELVKFEVDCGWMKVAGSDPVEYMKKYPGRIKMLHIKDFKPVTQPTTDLSGPGRPQGQDLGTGFVDYGPIFATGKSAGIEHIFAEQEAPFAVSQMESAKVDIAYMQKFNS